MNHEDQRMSGCTPPRPRMGRVAVALSLCAAGILCATGIAHAISSRTLFTPTGAAVNDELGWAVASAGDVNGDGYADVIVGAPYNDAGGADAGRAYIYFGGPAADAVPDLTLTGAAPGDVFGYSVAGAGDVNGDGYDDVIVGAIGNDVGGNLAGQAYVFFGGASPNSVADLTLTGAAATDELGYSVAGAGDVNGDGFADVIVGAPLNDAGGTDFGRAYVFFGGTIPNNSADVTVTGAATNDELGYSVAGAGDVNGDGFADMIVGAPFNSAGGSFAGRAYVYFGGASPNNVVDLTLTGAAASDEFGFSVAGAGDFNGDGFADVIVGAQFNDAGGNNAGQAYLYFGASGPNSAADVIFTGAVFDQLGNSVAGAGDIDGDGFADVIVGAYLNDGGAPNGGQAYVYLGGASPNNTADITLTGVAASDQFGESVAGAGDVDGDGFGDVIAATPYNGAGGSVAGRAYVTAIYPYDVLSPNGGERWVSGEPATVRWLGHDQADIAVSLDGGTTYATLVSGVGGLSENEYTLTAPLGATEFAKVRVSQTALAVRHSTSDASDGVFGIVPPAAPVAHRLARQLNGAAAVDNFGWAVANAGDVNGDGFADQIVGAPLNDAGGTNAGRAYVYFGGPDADAVADLTLTGAAAGDELGYSVAGAGDVNGDGFADVIVGAPFNDTGGANAGQVYVYFGGVSPNSTPDLTLTGVAALDELGYAVAGAGDVNGDGFADVILGEPFNDVGGVSAGQAYVYFGGASPNTIADLTMTGVAAGDEFGYSVGGAGDVNGDGFGDVIVGADLNDGGGASAGQAYVFFGGPAADAVADLTLTGLAAGDQFGLSVAGAGDVNGDGFADVIVGAPENDVAGTDAGQACVYFGAASPDRTAGLLLTGAAATDNFGYSVAGVGDVNGDGFADVIVGAPFNDAGGNGAGQAYVYFGGPSPNSTADLTLTGAVAADQLGYSVAGAGDVSGDGFFDVFVGADLIDAGGNNAGAALLHGFNRYFVLSPNDGETWNVGAAQSVSWLGAAPADLWLSVDAGRTYDLLRTSVGGQPSNSMSLIVPHAPTRFARFKLTPSDLSVTGLDESDSSFTIQTSVSLLSLAVRLAPEGGALLTWSTDPGIGPAGLAGYRVYRLTGAGGAGTRIGPDLIAESRYLDAAGGAGSRYRVAAVNGLGEELTLGEVSLLAARPLAAWPLPYRGEAMNISFATVGGYGGGTDEAVVAIYDLAGRQVREVARGLYRAGYQSAVWDGRDDSGRDLGNGVYFLLARSGGRTARVKLAVVR